MCAGFPSTACTGPIADVISRFFSLKKFTIKFNDGKVDKRFDFTEGGAECSLVPVGFGFDIEDLVLFEGLPFEINIVRARAQVSRTGLELEAAMEAIVLGPPNIPALQLQLTRPNRVECRELSLIPTSGPALLVAATLARQEIAVAARLSLFGQTADVCVAFDRNGLEFQFFRGLFTLNNGDEAGLVVAVSATLPFSDLSDSVFSLTAVCNSFPVLNFICFKFL